ncbi:competence type IV pilus minor pilin ComGF [Gracilibacillus xinjiangensis]|uniref:Competence type IV pilus minor pilin ComGF n=1 Tax=Gracilibacillus xinjiangensis TaxID=1193282 RepID=A0ABV8WYR8_9BACI
MLNQTANKSVSTVIKNNEAGFTLLTLLVAIVITISILSFTTQLIQITQNKNYSADYGTLQFFHYLEDEIFRTQYFYLSNNKIVFINENNDKISYSQYNNLIRRQVNGRGHEIMLRDVNKVEMSNESNNQIHLKVETKGGELFEKILSAV